MTQSQPEGTRLLRLPFDLLLLLALLYIRRQHNNRSVRTTKSKTKPNWAFLDHFVFLLFSPAAVAHVR